MLKLVSSFKVQFQCLECGAEILIDNDNLDISSIPCNCGCGQAWCTIETQCPECSSEVILYTSDPTYSVV